MDATDATDTTDTKVYILAGFHHGRRQISKIEAAMVEIQNK